MLISMDKLLPRIRAIALLSLRKFGPLNQINKTEEELFELLLELKRHKDSLNTKEEIVDEIADVWLTTLQLGVLFGWDDCVRRLEFKMDRLSKLVVGVHPDKIFDPAKYLFPF